MQAMRSGTSVYNLREAVPAVSRVGFSHHGISGSATMDLHCGNLQSEPASHFSVRQSTPIQEAEYHRVLQAMARDRADALMVNDTVSAHMPVVWAGRAGPPPDDLPMAGSRGSRWPNGILIFRGFFPQRRSSSLSSSEGSKAG